MANVKIFQDGEMAVSLFFKRHFFVFEDKKGETHWLSDDQGDLGSIKLWIQQADTNPTIYGVLPAWLITIDNLPLEQKFYEEIGDLAGKTVSAVYKDYRFVFEF